jgi:PAS domain S-box-containing protein
LAPVKSLYPDEEWKKIREENVRQKGIKYKLETKMIRKNHCTFDVELSLCILKSAEGKTVGSVGIIKDITKLKKTERKLIESEKRYRTIFDNSAVAITISDENECIVSWNKFAENLLHMNKDELFMKPVKSLYPQEEWEKLRSQNIRQKGMQHCIETKMIKGNSEKIDVCLSLSVIKNYNEDIIGSIGIIQDNSKQKNIENYLRKSEKKFRQLYQNAPIPYHTLTPEGIITNVNDTWCKIFGYPTDEVIGKSIFDFIDKKEKNSAKSSFKNKIDSLKPYTGGHERTFNTKSGEKRVFIIHDFLYFDENQNLEFIQTTMEDITNRKHIENELKLSEEKFRDLFENANDLIQSVNINGNFVYVNKQWMKTLGYSKNELNNLKITDIISKDHISYCMDLFKSICNGKSIDHIETVFVSKNGKEIYVEGNVSPWFKNGKFVATRGIFRDVTEHKQAEEALKDSEEKFRMLAEESPNMIFINKKGKVVYANKKCEEIMGYDRQEFYSSDFSYLDLIAPEFRPFIKENFKKHNAGKELSPYEYALINKNGKRFEAIITSKLIIYEGGEAILGIVTDISEQKKIEEELRRSKKEYLDVTNLTGDIIVKADKEGRWTFLNDEACKFWGKPRNKLLGTKFVDYLHPHDAEKTTTVIHEMSRINQMNRGLVNRQQTPNGWRIVEWNGAPIFDGSRKYIGFQATGRDITDQKKDEERLKESYDIIRCINKDLERKVKERTAEIENLLKQKDDFINQLGHDLKTPLTPLLSLLPILERTEDDPKSKEMLEVFHRNVDYMKNLVTKTIELARLNSPNTVLDIADINLWDVVDNSIKDQLIIFHDKNIKINNKIDKNILVKADNLRLDELFNNLINNSIKYTPVDGSITISSEDNGDFVKIKVSDDGVGMDKEQAASVFNEFYKADKSRHDFTSSGLGLSICKRIVEKHGGEIWAESPGLGKGSTFAFTLKKK